jgi:hypothetical protein
MKKQEKEKKNKKRGLIITFFVHGALIALALLPISQYLNEDLTDIELMADAKPEKIYTELNTEIMLSNETSRSSSRATAKPMSHPKPKPEPTPAPEPKEVVTDNSFEIVPIAVPEIPNNNENLNPAPPTPNPLPNPGTLSNSTSNGNGTIGEIIGDVGNGDHGNGIWGNDNGSGKFSRKVVSRPEAELKKLTKQRGTMVIRLAIDRDGKILDSKYMKDLSSIKHDNMGNAAAKIARKYKFDRDYKVAEIQYCNITIVFEQ